jgi:hypothetical protein
MTVCPRSPVQHFKLKTHNLQQFSPLYIFPCLPDKSFIVVLDLRDTLYKRFWLEVLRLKYFSNFSKMISLVNSEVLIKERA